MEAFLLVICDLVEECRLVVVEALEDGAHEGLTDKSAAIRDAVFIAKALQRTLFAFVEENRDPMFAGLLLHVGRAGLEHKYKF